jgi:hypothetical protein
MSTDTQQTAAPLAYFITFTCYGTWLHGGKTTSVDRQHNVYGRDLLTFNQARKTSAKNRMSELPYLLDEKRRCIVLDAIKEVCHY